MQPGHSPNSIQCQMLCVSPGEYPRAWFTGSGKSWCSIFLRFAPVWTQTESASCIPLMPPALSSRTPKAPAGSHRLSFCKALWSASCPQQGVLYSGQKESRWTPAGHRAPEWIVYTENGTFALPPYVPCAIPLLHFSFSCPFPQIPAPPRLLFSGMSPSFRPNTHGIFGIPQRSVLFLPVRYPPQADEYRRIFIWWENPQRR